MAIGDVRDVLRALAEARDKEFYGLWVILTRSWPKPMPGIEFRIYQVSDSADIHVVVHVDGTRPDGTEVDWSLAVTTRQDGMIIEGSVSARTPEDDGSAIFSTSEETSDPQQAASLIRAIATEVCGQREWLTSA